MKRISFTLILPLLVLFASCNRDPKEVAKKYVASGNKYYDKGQLREASIMYRRALQKDILNAQAHYHLGLVELKQRFFAEALRSLHRAVDIDADPKKTDSGSKLDKASRIDDLAKTGEIELLFYMSNPVTFKSQLNDLEDTIKLIFKADTKAFEGLRLSAFMALAQIPPNRPLAIQYFREADQVKPDQPELEFALIKALFSNKQEAEAEAMTKDLIAKHKNYGDAYTILYVYYATTNRTSDAEDILKLKVANNPKVGRYVIELAQHYHARGNKDAMSAAIARLTSDPNTFPNGHMLAGDFYGGINDLDRAMKEYQEGEKADPSHKFDYSKHQVEVLAREGKGGEAARMVGELIKDHPKDIQTVAMHAALLTQSGDPAQAQKAIDELAPLLPATPPDRPGDLQILHFNLARALVVKGDPGSLDQARLHLQEALKVQIGNRDFLPALLLLGQVQLRRGESAKAVETANKILEQAEGSIPAHLMRSLGMIGLNEFDKARKEVLLVLEHSPNNPDAYFQLAGIDFTQKNYKEAEQIYLAMMKANDPRGIEGVVNCRMRMGDFEGALAPMREAINKNPDRMEFHRVIAQIYVEAKRFDEALAEYQIILRKEPTEFNYIRFAAVQRFAGHMDDSIVSLKKAHELAPRDPSPTLQLAMAYDVTGRTDEARKGYEDVLKLAPENTEALNNLAYSKADEGVDLDLALSYAERARTKAPDSLQISDTIGLIYLRKNLIEDSVRVLSDVVNRDPTSATFHLHYAMALYQKGDKPAARKELDAATRTGPTDKEKMRIQELRQKIS